jgi:hypothetical protein
MHDRFVADQIGQTTGLKLDLLEVCLDLKHKKSNSLFILKQSLLLMHFSALIT